MAEKPKAPVVIKRRGRFVAGAGRTFQSVPFGVTLNARPGAEYDLGAEFAYLWVDPQFAHLWEWLEDERKVTLVAEKVGDKETGRWVEPEPEAKA